MKVRIKRVDTTLPLPQYETAGAVAFDFIVREDTVIPSKGVGRAPSNVIIEIPKGYMIWVTDRSSTIKKTGLIKTEGIIDQDYCGDTDEILLQFYNPTDSDITIKRGDRVSQGILLPVGRAEWEEVSFMNRESRGGFGSTDTPLGSPSLARRGQGGGASVPPPKRGKLIVIDGTDGSGKGTQTDLLMERLTREGHASSKIDFPQYSQKSAGLIENYLNGRYGNPDKLSPYIASFFYALDRYDASFDFKKLLDNGEVVVSNRYTSSNMGHQGSKFGTSEGRQRYFEWLDTYEHDVFGIPRPDITLVLHVPPEHAQNLIEKKAARKYIQGKSHDLLESNMEHQRRAEETYLGMCRLFPNYKLIKCVRDSRLLSVEEVHELIWEQVQSVLQ